MRGGVSKASCIGDGGSRFSPRAWRCFCGAEFIRHGVEVFSTCVEVFLPALSAPLSSVSFLHVRGGVSLCRGLGYIGLGFSPRAWRCFLRTVPPVHDGSVFSTCVEVFLQLRHCALADSSFLHVRGGVSIPNAVSPYDSQFSPRVWRCFREERDREPRTDVFSTCVVVFPTDYRTALSAYSFLHVCGGVSIVLCVKTEHNGFSPRAWRCFPLFFCPCS